MAVTIKMTESVDRDAIAALERVEIGLRGSIVSQARKTAGQIVARRMRELCPPPGYKYDKPGLKPLRDTIRVADREKYGMTLVGPEYPAGAHGHLVEAGHVAVDGSLVPPHPFARPAADETLSQQEAALSEGIQKGVEAALTK